MRLSRKPAARRRRRVFVSLLVIIIAGSALALTLLRRDPARAYAVGLGLTPVGAATRTAATLPVDLAQAPYGDQLAASKAAGLDFGRQAGQRLTEHRFDIGRLAGTDQTVWLHVYVIGRRVSGAFLTTGDNSVCAPVNSPSVIIEPH